MENEQIYGFVVTFGWRTISWDTTVKYLEMLAVNVPHLQIIFQELMRVYGALMWSLGKVHYSLKNGIEYYISLSSSYYISAQLVWKKHCISIDF